MKKLFAIILAAALLCAAGLAESNRTAIPERGEYAGTWVADRATLTIEDLDDVIICTVRWASSAWETTEWVYENCMYDEVSGGLSTFETGIKTNLVYDGDGEIVSSEVVCSDGAANFLINGEGLLVWTDFKETPGENETLFEKAGDAAEGTSGDAAA